MSNSSKRNRELPVRCSRLRGEPVMKLSRPITSWPFASRRSHKWEPMNPAAPETRFRKRVSLRHLSGIYRPCYSAVCTMAFSRVEVLVLLTFFVASAGLFWRRFGSVVSKIRQAKPDADFHLAPLNRRVRDFIWEVMLQAKVIRERPWPGLAHAFVFWGFCAFALVTINHLATGFGFPLLSRT